MKNLPDRDAVCPICGQVMATRIEPWLLYCHGCGFWRALLGSGDHRLKDESAVIEARRLAGLLDVRQHNNEIILNLLERQVSLRELRILDVGCSYGWFMQAAAKRGAITTGIEPERAVAATALQAGCSVRIGYFPQCMQPAERFDVIVFNDVLEHLPDVGRVLQACHDSLVEGGMLAINLPVSSGIVFRLARIFAAYGCKAPFGRLWQKGYRSPHLSYFNGDTLGVVTAKHGFRLLHRQRLKTVMLPGLWARLTMDRDRPSLIAVATYAAVLLAYPLLSWLAPADIMLYLFDRVNATE